MKSIYTIKRHLESTIETISKQFKCVIVTGPRQIGKSTILNEVLPKIKHFNYVKLDNDEIVNHAKNDPNGFLDSHPAPLFIDEVQKAPRLFSYIKSIVDRSDERGQFVVTGSESFELMKGVGDHLSTRAAVISMQSLSISEINGTENFVFDPNFAKFLKRKQPSLTQLQIFEKIIKGSMPDIINGNITNNNVFYEAYVKSTITKDMKEDWVDIKDASKFTKFLKVLSGQVGQIINVKTIAQLTGISTPTCETWIYGLIAMGIIFFVHPYSPNVLTKTTRKPKLYFYDTGLACYLAEYSDSYTLMNSEYAGHIFECYVISELSKSYINASKMKTLYYAKKHDLANGRIKKDYEIDLIIEGPGGIIYPIEIKKTSTPQTYHFNNAKILIGNTKSKIGIMTLICTAPSASTMAPNKLVLPVHWL